VFLAFKTLELRAPCKARWVWSGAVAKCFFGPRAHCRSLRPAAPQQEKSNSADVQRGRVGLHVGSGKLILAVMYLRRVRVAGRSYAAAPAHVSVAVTLPEPTAQNIGLSFRRPCRGRRLAGQNQLGRCAAEQIKCYRLHRYIGKLALAVMYLRRVRVGGRTFAPLLTHV
jgi:hypothetical protein